MSVRSSASLATARAHGASLTLGLMLAFAACAPAWAQTSAAPAPIRAGAPPLPGTPAVGGAATTLPSAAPLPLPAPRPAMPVAAPALDPTSKAYVEALQRALPAHGYHPGPQTGRLDPATLRAIRAYRHDAGLNEDAASPMALKETIDSVLFAQPPVMADHAASAHDLRPTRRVDDRLLDLLSR